MSDITEEELIKIVNSKKCKSVRINNKNYYISKKVKDELKKSQHVGGFAFLAAIPAIIAALAGGATVASKIAETVSNSREAIKKQKEIELIDSQKSQTEGTGQGLYLNPYQGTGLYLNPYQGTAIHKFIKNIDPNMKPITKKFKNGLKILHKGKGLYLNPYSVANQAEIEDETETETETETESETETDQ